MKASRTTVMVAMVALMLATGCKSLGLGGMTPVEQATVEFNELSKQYEALADNVVAGRRAMRVTDAQWQQYTAIQAQIREHSAWLRDALNRWITTNEKPESYDDRYAGLRSAVEAVAVIEAGAKPTPE